jgi:hypothetical protein
MESTNISNYPEVYPMVIEPTTHLGNKGIYFVNAIKEDLVVEQGTSGIWEYRKWYSGKVECWGRWAVGVTIDIPWGALYYAQLDAYPFPSGLFKSAPTCQITAECRDTIEPALITTYGLTTATHAPSVILMRPVGIAVAGYNILYYAIGNWK